VLSVRDVVRKAEERRCENCARNTGMRVRGVVRNPCQKCWDACLKKVFNHPEYFSLQTYKHLTHLCYAKNKAKNNLERVICSTIV